MAKYISSGLIPFIKGSLGGDYFSYWLGIPIIRKRPKRRRKIRLTAHQKKTGEVLFMLHYNWKNMDFKEQALWAEYTKRYTKMKTSQRDGLCPHIGNKMTALNAYISVNLLMISAGFKPTEKPPLSNIGKPPCPSIDIVDCGVYEDVIKFNIWLHRSYPVDCVAQVWVKEGHGKRYPYIAQISEVSESKTRITIDKIKTKVKNKTVEKGFVELENCKVYLQFRTIAENGEFSTPSAICKLQVKSTKLKHKPPKRILDFLHKYY